MRTTEFAPPVTETTVEQAPVQGYGKPSVALRRIAGRFSGQDFALQPDGTLHCPANQSLVAHERRREVDGSLRVVYAASIRSCRPCPLREQCQWQGSATKKPRQVSVLLHPLIVGSEPIRWHDWSRRSHRRACIQLVRQESRQGRGRISHHGPPHCHACAPFPCSTCPLSADLGQSGWLAMRVLLRLDG